MNYDSLRFNPRHSFKRGIRSILDQHFTPKIANNFELILELERFVLDPKRTPNLINQKRDERFVCEVYYRNPSGLFQYICDLSSWWDKKTVEITLLKYITDKLKTGAIGSDWKIEDIHVSHDILSGRYQTPDSEIAYGLVPTKLRKGVKQ